MKPSAEIKSISYLKAHASEIVNTLSETSGTMVITQNGEAKAVVQDIKAFEQTQESLALLKILALSSQNLEKGKVKSARESFESIRQKIEKNEAE